MKNQLKYLFAPALLVALLSACNTFELDKKAVDAMTEHRKTLTQSEVYYTGKADNNNHTFSVTLMTDGMSVGYDTKYQPLNYYNTGYVFTFTLNGNAITSPDTIPAGIYKIATDATNPEMTFQSGTCIVVADKVAAKAKTSLKITDGTIAVSLKNGKYTFSIKAKTILGTEVAGEFTGKEIVIADPLYRGESNVVTEQTFTATDMTFAVEDYPEFSVETLILKGDKGYAVIEIIGPLYGNDKPTKPTPGDYLASGTNQKGTFTLGEIYKDNPSGSYIMGVRDKETPEMSSNSIWYVSQGKMNVAENGDITIDVTSALGSRVTMEYKKP